MFQDYKYEKEPTNSPISAFNAGLDGLWKLNLSEKYRSVYVRILRSCLEPVDQFSKMPPSEL